MSAQHPVVATVPPSAMVAEGLGSVLWGTLPIPGDEARDQEDQTLGHFLVALTRVVLTWLHKGRRSKAGD